MKVQHIPAISRVFQMVQTVTIVQHIPLGQHQLPIKTVAQNSRHVVLIPVQGPGEQRSSVSSARTGDTRLRVGPLPTERQNSGQWEQPELKCVKREDGESIVMALSVDSPPAALREKGVQNECPGELSCFPATLVPRGDTASHRGARASPWAEGPAVGLAVSTASRIQVALKLSNMEVIPEL